MSILRLRMQLSTYVGEGIEQTCTVRDLTEHDFTPTQLAALEHILVRAGQDPAPPRSVPTLVQQGAASHMLQPVPASPHGDRVAAAKQQGFTGAMCTQCSSLSMKRNGACEVCVDCGTTTGCS
jgi:hypothetical protein